jgi:maltooligosyltrehalose trehalohydrolase
VFDDAGAPHVLASVTAAARAAAPGRCIYVAAENEPQDVRLLRNAKEHGFDLDAMWNDDFHHCAAVALTARSEAYKKDYRGVPQEFVSGAKYGWLFQGQRYDWQVRRRGTPTFGFGRERFINYLDNHDQVANAPGGARSHRLASPGRYRSMTALLLLGPQTPLLFQGQEFASSAPFFYFADHDENLAELVRAGRADFLSQFPSQDTPEMRATLPSPADAHTFQRCKLDPAERARNGWAVALHRDLLRIRREDPVVRRSHDLPVDGAVLTGDAFVLRYFGPDGDDRLLVVNLGRDTDFTPAPEPLLAPPAGRLWRVLWCSEHPDYGGHGSVEPEQKGRWHFTGETAWLLGP